MAATDNIGLEELSLLTAKECRRCTDRDLVTYGGQLVSFVKGYSKTLLSGLSRLKLENLRLGESSFHNMLARCGRLEFLRLYNCHEGDLSVLKLEHQRLSELEIIKCGFERVDLNCLPKLTTLTLSYWKSRHDCPMSFDHVPLLRTVTMNNTAFSYHKMLKLSEVLGKATISDLRLNFESEKIWIKPEGPRELSQVFDKLKLVNLADISDECDLKWTLFLLEGAPNLKELCLSVWNRCDLVRGEKDRKKLELSKEKKDAGTEWESSASDFKHHNLAVLRIFGFELKDKFVNYINGVMASAVDLNGLYLYKRPGCGTCVCRKRKDGYPWTKEQRDSLLNSFNMDACPLLRVYFPSLRT